MALQIGTKAPAFTLKSKNADGLADISPLDNVGSKNVVLLFFPLAFTSVCADEMCSVRDQLKEYEKLEAQVYAISVDSPFTQEVFAKEKNLNFPLLSDFNREVSKKYDVLFEDLLGFKGVSKRAAFVINKEGTIVYATDSNDPKQLPDFEAMKKVLAEG
ncbi:MAG: redoxin domain-containing protein [Opitutales bacterium]|nr:redoxin domain-containing protein [Opitutales bacterium]